MKNNKNNKTILCVIFLFIAFLLILFIFIFQKKSEVPESSEFSGKDIDYYIDLNQNQYDEDIRYKDKWYSLKRSVSSYLLMGIDNNGEAKDNGSYNDGGQADVLILLVIDDDAKTISFLQINRDTMAEVEVLGVMGDVVGTLYEQLAAAHFYGNGLSNSCENTVRAVSKFLYGIKIDAYAAVNLDAVSVINDDIGGVTVAIEDDFSNVDSSLLKGSTVTLNGTQAYNYIRARMSVGDGTNLERMRRHREYINGAIEAFRKAFEDNGNLILKLISDINPYWVTDLSVNELIELADRTEKYIYNGIFTIDGEAIVGENFMEFYADDDSVKENVIRLFYEESNK